MSGAADRWLFAPAPPTRLGSLRVFIGLYSLVFIAARIRHLWNTVDLPERQFEPVGVLAWMSDPLPASWFRLMIVASIPLGIAFVAGKWFRFTGPAFAVVFLLVTTYRLSWGHVIHTEHLVVVHLFILGFAASAAAASLNARGKDEPAAHERFGWPVQLMALATVITYVLAGIAKLRNGGMDWLVGDVLRNQVAFDNLRKELLGSWHSPFAASVVSLGWLFPPFAIATVAVELGAPLALLGGKWRTAWFALAWAFHVGIALLMWISFPYQLFGLAYLPFFRTERLLAELTGRQPVTSPIA